MNPQNTLSWLLFSGLLAALLLVGMVSANGQTNASSLVMGNSQFACDLYSRLKSTDGNLFFSPYSISTCLAMVATGANGDTAAQMNRALHFPDDSTALGPSFASLQAQLNQSRQPNAVELNIANALWSQQGHPFLPGYLAAAKQDFGANLNQADFKTAAEPARQQINQWVSDQTSGRIKDLIAAGVLRSDTRLVLINAIYFKSKWQTPFKKASTTEAQFSVTSDKTTTAHFMHGTERFNYAETDDLQLLELPYASNTLSMIILLPKTGDGLPAVESRLTWQNLASLRQQLSQPAAVSRRVDVYLPRFKLTSQFSLGDTLAGMGMSSAFSPQADFSGMDGARDLFLSAVVHKAFVEVNEEGTEAAAATGVTMRALAVRPLPVPIFRADHPFIFLIQETHSGSILFLGRVSNPAE